MFTKLDAFWRQPSVYWLILGIIAAASPLAFAPYYCFWLMPLLFGAFIRLLELRETIQIKSTYFFALIMYTAQFYWVHTALHDVSGLPNLYALPLTLLMPIYLAIYPTLAIVLWRQFSRYFALNRTQKIGITLPVFWTLGEIARAQLINGFDFGWGALGYSQIADASPLAGLAPLAGIHLVTLATAFISAWLVLLIDSHDALKKRFIFFFLTLALIMSAGFAKTLSFTQATGFKTRVALLQGNIEQGIKFHEDQFLHTVQRYLDLTEQAGKQADLIIFPETAITAMRQDLPSEFLQAFATRAPHSELAIGIAQYTSDGINYENAVIHLTEQGLNNPQQMPYYAKNHLVPFGEYKPLPMLTEPLYRSMNMPLSDFQRGGIGQKPFSMSNQQVAFNICYEDGFGDELIASARQSTLLANASNMAWYGDSNAMFQHLQQSQARALELGRYMVRATNTGVTAIVDNHGHIIAQAPINQATILVGEIEGFTGQTPYMKIGGSWAILSLLVFILLSLILFKRHSYRKE